MFNQLRSRIFSSVVLVLLFSSSIIFCKWLYAILIILVGICMGLEWMKMTSSKDVYAKYGFIILFSTISLIYIRFTSSYQITLIYFFSIWATDTFAMIGGKTFGGSKLAPQISPLKTWSGLLCGCLASAITCKAFALLLDVKSFAIDFFYYGFVNGIIAQTSDIFVSYFKRKCNIKDSGNFIPGHGGFLDRFDSIIFSAPLLVLMI